jgi:protoporphyrinogen oxidase
MRVGILGGGICGIALQRFLDHPCEVLEADARPGGLCQTYWKDGFGYDIGGHILFSKHQEINELVDAVLGENINRCRRANKILFKGQYVKYPFENDLAALDKEDCYECLIGYLKADYPKPKNFQEWMYYTFGQGLTEKYLLPYNRKIWKTEPSQMGVEWVERIPKPPVEDVVKSALGIPTEGYTHQLFFRYPLHGGIEALVKSLVRPQSSVVCNARVRAIRKDGSGWEVSDDQQTRRYDHIVVSFPIHEAARCFSDLPPEIERALAGLRYNAVRVAMIAVNNESLMDRSAIYIPDPEVLPHRVCYMGFFSPNMVRPGTSSLIAEVTSQPGSELDRMGNDAILDRIVADLDRVGVIRKQDVIASEIRRFEYAYPVYDLDYTRNVAVVREYFASLGIDLLGRFAEFDYINMDECLRRAVALAEKLNKVK